MPGMADATPGASSDVDIRTVRFLDHYLKSVGPAPVNVRLYDVVLKEWRDLDEWPSADPTVVLPCVQHGLAATTTTDGDLIAMPSHRCDDYLVHDPGDRHLRAVAIWGRNPDSSIVLTSMRAPMSRSTQASLSHTMP